MRDMYSSLAPQEKRRWFVARNRLNGPTVGMFAWWKPHSQPPALVLPSGEEIGGGWFCAGPLYHTFDYYFPAQAYFKDHPEYFSMRNGQRVPGGANGNHLCLTNPDVLRLMIQKVKEQFRAEPTSNYAAVSVNDGGCATICDCPPCRTVAQREGESGLLLQFVNAVADAIKEEYPRNYLVTFAYIATAQPPKTICGRDNVIVWVCNGLASGQVFYPTPPAQNVSYRNLAEWTKFVRHIWCWDYLRSDYVSMNYFAPVLWKLDEQFKLVRNLPAVTGIFQQNDAMVVPPVLVDQYELRHWVSAKLMENPDRRMDLLIEDFLKGYYGRAAPHLQRYLTMVRRRLPQWPYRMVDYEFMTNAQRCFDRAEAAVRTEPELLDRVQAWRVNLDITALNFRHQLTRDYTRRGGDAGDYPYRIAVLKERILGALARTTSPHLLMKYPCWKEGKPVGEVPVREQTREYVELLCQGKESAPLTEQFQSLAPERVIDVMAPQLTPCAWTVADPEAALGLALEAKDPNPKELPILVGLYDLASKKQRALNSIKAEDLPGRGYHWYRLGQFPLGEWTYLHLLNWRITLHMHMLCDPRRPDRQWEAWASVKFTGPQYPHGEPGAPNRLYVDRVILIDKGEESDETGAAK